MEILYNYKAYDTPKKGVFNVETGEYKLPIGWLQKEVECIIIGETDLHYVEELLPSSHGEWVGDVVVEHKYILPIGLHKSRLVKWIDSQLCLF
jgi:hypothetical protein